MAAKIKTDITIEQNSDKKLNQLAAKTVLYDRVQWVQFLQAIIPVSNAIVWPVLLWCHPSWTVGSAFCGLIIPLFDELILVPRSYEWKIIAAKIQELFDCELLHIPWNYAKNGKKPTTEIILKFAQKYNESNRESLKDWYPVEIQPLPVEFARLICQRANCWWDAELRKRYADLLTGSVSVIALLAFVICLATGFTLAKFVLCVIAPLTPAILWAIKERKIQLEAAIQGKDLLDYSIMIWHTRSQNADTINDMERLSRILQDGIFDRRKTSPVTPFWLYKFCRLGDEHTMKKVAQEMVKEYDAAMANNPESM